MIAMYVLAIDAPVASILVGAFLAVASIAASLIMMRNNNTQQIMMLNQNSQMLLQTANKETVAMLEKQIIELKDKVHELEQKYENKVESETQLRQQNYELMERIMGLQTKAYTPRRTRKPKDASEGN